MKKTNYDSKVSKSQNIVYRHIKVSLLFIAIMATSCTSKKTETQVVTPNEITVCGTVQFSDACSEELDSMIAYGLALVHHMTYEDAENVFEKVIKTDPDCFWGHWGKALTFIHPLWPDTPTEEQLKFGWDLTQKALSIASKEKEKLYGKVLAVYYEDGLNKTEKERLKNYEQAWEMAFEQAPEDLEVKLFYALSILSTVNLDDKTYKKQIKAGALAEEVLEVIPDHPGGFHYAIHAYDYPSLANKAIELANKYDKIAPEIPHALHMPTHIFTRQGMWSESINWNIRSAEAALKNPVNGSISMHYFHALDYLVYAYLQRLEDKKVENLLNDIENLNQPFHSNFASAYSLAAMEARLALERQDWSKASKLEARKPSNFEWDKFPESEAITHFAIGLGSARNGSYETAEKSIAKLEELQKKTVNEYWKKQVEIQKNSVKAWLAFKKGDKENALELMTRATNIESATEKHVVTPGELLSAVELLGDMLMELDKPEEAIARYEQSLVRSPGRFNSLYGAGRAAELSGNHEKAKSFYENLVNISVDAQVSLDRRKLAMAYLGN